MRKVSEPFRSLGFVLYRVPLRFNIDLLRWASLSNRSKSHSSLHVLFSPTAVRLAESVLYQVEQSSRRMSTAQRQSPVINYREWARAVLDQRYRRRLPTRNTSDVQRQFLSILCSSDLSVDGRNSARSAELCHCLILLKSISSSEDNRIYHWKDNRETIPEHLWCPADGCDSIGRDRVTLNMLCKKNGTSVCLGTSVQWKLAPYACKRPRPRDRNLFSQKQKHRDRRDLSLVYLSLRLSDTVREDSIDSQQRNASCHGQSNHCSDQM